MTDFLSTLPWWFHDQGPLFLWGWGGKKNKKKPCIETKWIAYVGLLYPTLLPPGTNHEVLLSACWSIPPGISINIKKQLPCSRHILNILQVWKHPILGGPQRIVLLLSPFYTWETEAHSRWVSCPGSHS